MAMKIILEYEGEKQVEITLAHQNMMTETGRRYVVRQGTMYPES